MLKIDFSLLKKLNDIGITGAIHFTRNNNVVKQLANTTYNKLGVFLDHHCYSKEITTFILSKVIVLLKFS